MALPLLPVQTLKILEQLIKLEKVLLLFLQHKIKKWLKVGLDWQ